jgi:Leucine-rich repeat (LRR) protein
MFFTQKLHFMTVLLIWFTARCTVSAFTEEPGEKFQSISKSPPRNGTGRVTQIENEPPTTVSLNLNNKVQNNQPVRIMPLGNSVTQSNYAHYSYRYFLWKKLVAAHVNFDFVGTLNSNRDGNPEWPEYMGLSFDRDHEGHWGFRTDEILAELPEWTSYYFPDIVLLHIGSNDCLQGISIESTVLEIKQIIAELRNKNSSATILLAKLIPFIDTSVNNRINALNANINHIADEVTTPLSKVIAVDQNTGFDVTKDTFDGGHPNESGEEKMATIWFDALSNLIFPARDSLALVSLYESTSGPDWNNNTGWLSGPLTTWYGVQLRDRRVTALQLQDNKLSGSLPEEVGDLTALQVCNLSDNNLAGTIPQSITNLTQLESLILFSNQFSDLPDLSVLSNLETLRIQNNQFMFDGIEPNIGIKEFEYNPQDSIGERKDLTVEAGSDLTLFTAAGGEHNLYQWLKDGEPVSGATSSEYQISPVTLSMEGKYYCIITNSIVQDLTLVTRPIRVTVQLSGFHRDSLALVALYHDTDGPHWLSHKSWLADPLENWIGITINGNRVTALQLDQNNLTGKLSAEIGSLDSLTELRLSGNRLAGSIPAEIGELSGLQNLALNRNELTGMIPESLTRLPNLRHLLLQSNKLTSCPDFSGSALESLEIQENRLTFEDIETNITVPGLIYAPQDSVGETRTVSVSESDSLSLIIEVDGKYNQYQWFRNGNMLSGSVDSELEFPCIQPGDSGTYDCQISNSVVTDLILISRPFLVIVTGRSGLISPPPPVLEKTALSPNFPNPFNPSTCIEYQLAENQRVQLFVTDLRGRNIRTLVNQYQSRGTYRTTWNGQDRLGSYMASSVYFICLKTQCRTIRLKCLLLK